MEKSKDLWLLKCSGKILGPHTTAELEELIKNQDVMVLDEAAAPNGRWHYLRDVQQFAAIFVVLKNKEEFFNETTNSLDTVDGTDSATVTASQALPPNVIGFRNSEKLLRGVQAQLGQKENGDDLTATDPGVPAQVEREVKPVTGSTQPVKVFGATSDPQMRQRVQRKSSQRLLWLLGLLAVGGIIGAQVQSRRAPADFAKSHNFEQIYAEGLHAKKRGEFDKAKELFNSALVLRPKDEDAILQVVPILIDREEIVSAKRYLEDIRGSTKPDTIKSAENLLGLALLKSGDSGEAEAHFHNALALDAQYVPALHNSAAVALTHKQYKRALEYARRAILTKNAVATTPLLFGEAAIGSMRSDDPNGAMALTEGIAHLQKTLVSTYDYGAETKILIGYLTLLKQPTMQEAVQKMVEEVADEDPNLTQDHIHDLRFYNDRANSNAVFQWLRDLAQLLPMASPKIKGLVGVQEFRGHDKQDGKQMVVDAVEQSPSDPILLALKGYILRGAGNEAQTYIDLALKYTTHEKLPHILKARLCQEKNDFVCATQQWQAVAAQDPQYPPAVIGIAESARREGQLLQAWKLVESHIYRSPTYRPYIDLQMDLEEKSK